MLYWDTIANVLIPVALLTVPISVAILLLPPPSDAASALDDGPAYPDPFLPG